MERRETQRFLARIYQEGDRFEVLYRHEGGSVARKERLHTSDTAEAFLDEVQRAEEQGYNVYVSAMPLDVQATGKYDRIWIDQDDVEGPWPFGADPTFEGTQWPQPSTLVKTSEAVGGFRWQAIWLLKTPIEAGLAKHAMKTLAKSIGGDEGVHDSRRVLRLAGVMNAKRGSAARLMDTNAEPISFSAFDVPQETALTKMLTADVQNPNHVLGEFIDGVTEGDRNRKAYMAARQLKASGVSHGDAGAFLLLGASRCEPPLNERELEHALNSAYHRGT